MQGTRSAATETYQLDSRGSEQRARPQAAGTVVYSASPKVYAIIKANAYGHGIARIAPAFAAADGLGILELDAACALRDHDYAGPVLLLEGFFAPAELPEFAARRFAAAVHCEEQLRMLETTRLDRSIEIWLKVNTGMNRLGFPPREVPAALARLQGLHGVSRIGLMTHFAAADEPGGVAEQLAVFRAATAGLQLPVSVANSAAILGDEAALGDVLRPGIMIYGSSPTRHKTAAELGLRPAMELSAEIIAVQHLLPGDRVGYGGTFSAETSLSVGVVACGYADGYPRHAPTGTPVLVEGRRTRLLGRVSMDMITVDLTPVPEARVGSKVELWGRSLPVDEVAQAAGTIAYELLCAVAGRVPFAVSSN
ncbi:MAG: alanine racemase [Burkholderiales bacterium]|nr:MAG: alanine racemase [Burkholderiales bacterium]